MASHWPCYKDAEHPRHSWISWRYPSGRVALRCERCTAPHPTGALAFAAEVAKEVRKVNIQEARHAPV